MRTVTRTYLQSIGGICPLKLTEGVAQYHSRILEGDETMLRQDLLNRIAVNGWEHSWVDFYYGRLQPEEQQRVMACLPEAEQNYLEGLALMADDLYFPLNPQLFEITFRLSVSEALFSTYYFTKEPSTVWTNFERKFVILD